MSDVETIDSATVRDEERFHTDADIRKLRKLTLAQASALSRLSVHELKEAIREGKLQANWKGRYTIASENLALIR